MYICILLRLVIYKIRQCSTKRVQLFRPLKNIKHYKNEDLYYTHHYGCVNLQHCAQQTSYAQLLITGLFCLTKTIKCSTFKWRLPQADLGEDHPFTIELLQRAEYYTGDPVEGLGKCPCTPTGCHGRLHLGHRGRERELRRKKMDLRGTQR